MPRNEQIRARFGTSNPRSDMPHVFGLVLLVLAIVFHEGGHAIAMTRRGIEIEEVSIGLPMGKLRLTLRPRFLPYPVHFTPLVVGAYVKPTDRGQQQLEAMSYKDQASCYGAGVLMNILTGGLMWVIGLTIALQLPQYDHHRDRIRLFVILPVLVLVVLLRRLISRVLPLFGIGALVALVLLVVTSPGDAGGPVSVVRASAGSSSMLDALDVGVAISLSLAFFNMIPLVPLDGGRTMVAWLRKIRLRKFSNVYAGFSACCFFGFVLFMMFSDIRGL